jgi:primosomal protein N' (replication factor Y) (superfamily II helicase)
MTFADVILPVPLPKLLTYSIPDKLSNIIKPGVRVNVALGNKKIYTGIVYDIHSNKPEYKTRDIDNVLDEETLIDEIHLKYWKWVANYYQCSLNDVIRAALPTSLKPESETFVSLCHDYDSSIVITSSEDKILRILDADKTISVNQIAKDSGIKNVLTILNSLNIKGRIEFHKNLKSDYKPIYTEYLRLVPKEKDLHNVLDNLKRAPQQLKLINYLIEINSSSSISDSLKLSSIYKQTGTNKTIINSLKKKGIVKIVKIETSRFEEVDSTAPLPILSQEQEKAYNSILNGLKKSGKVLLHGVTGSGKTEIYIHLINKAISENKQVLYLLPEIALTTQIIRRLQVVFGKKVGVFHSKYSDSARAEVWKRLKNKDYQIILGVRSAVFLPFSNLGLVIIDEEHENSYKQYDPAPRYHARDSAIMLSSLFNAYTVLGTATPSLESYYNTKIGKYSLVELKTRFAAVEMPEIQIVDTADAYKRKIMQEHFHPELVNAIKTALHNGEQVILFQNRRGYSPYVECYDCAWIPQCNKCSVNYTYHKYKNKLICHYCGDTIDMPKVCPDCGSKKIANRGFGTEMIEDEATLFFPEAGIKRMDLDTTGTRKKYEHIIHDFEKGKIDILIGTQMVTKGLDFDNVGVVGILNADNMLNFPDFRAFERSYQLMAQVSGRAGRKHKQGKVLIQTRDKEHPIIQFVVLNDYKSMFDSQLEERELFKYPPYYKFIVIKIKHKDALKLTTASIKLSNELKSKLGDAVSTPIEPTVSKVYNYYIREILIRLKPDSALASKKRFISEYLMWFSSIDEAKGTLIQIDVDPL